MKRLAPFLLAPLVLAACGSQTRTQPPAPQPEPQQQHAVAAQAAKRCAAGYRPLGSSRLAYAGVVREHAVAYRAPGGARLVAFGRVNVNDYPTVLGVVGKLVRGDCSAAWLKARLPAKPNGATGWVRARDVDLEPVRTRIVVDLSARRVTLYRSGRPVLSSRAAVGAPATPTPTGRFYVDQRLVPEDADGPFGPGALGISAFSEVLTGWTQGGPVAIHGTNEPWLIGRAISNGCIRLPNDALRRFFRLAVAGTPVVIRV